jgi:hypothetical protein
MSNGDPQITPEMKKAIAEIMADAIEKIIPLLSRTERSFRRPTTQYDCTGTSFGCDSFYICDNNNHSCKTDSSFSCGGRFDCTGGAFGIVLG